MQQQHYLDHPTKITSICKFEHNIQFILFYERCKIANYVWMVQLLNIYRF